MKEAGTMRRRLVAPVGARFCHAGSLAVSILVVGAGAAAGAVGT
jgi:hypothetical protein